MTSSVDRSGGARPAPWVRGPGAVLVLVVAMCLTLGGLPLRAQSRPSPQAVQTTAGVNVPVSFSDFHTLTATTDYLKKVAAANPAITELVEIGRSAGNRPIYVLVVSNMKKGVTIDSLVALQRPRTPAVNNVTPMKPYQGKPGQWIDGGLHGNDRAGTEACLYIIDKLVTGYGTDAEISEARRRQRVLHLPRAESRRARDRQRRQQRQGRSSGRRPTATSPKAGGKTTARPAAPATSPRLRPKPAALLEFFTNHTNILLVQSFDTGGTTTFRPFARWPESRVEARDVAVFDRLIGRKYLELVGEAVPASWTAPLTERTQGTRPAGCRSRPRGAGAGQRAAGAAQTGDQAAARTARAVEQARRLAQPVHQRAPGTRRVRRVLRLGLRPVRLVRDEHATARRQPATRWRRRATRPGSSSATRRRCCRTSESPTPARRCSTRPTRRHAPSPRRTARRSRSRSPARRAATRSSRSRPPSRTPARCRRRWRRHHAARQP